MFLDHNIYFLIFGPHLKLFDHFWYRYSIRYSFVVLNSVINDRVSTLRKIL